jgi:methyl-accepting chemotaxis protein
MQQLDQVIQQNASAAEEMSAGSDALSGQAEALKSAISFFKLGGMQEQSRRPGTSNRKTGLSQRPATRPSATAKAKPDGFDIEIDAESAHADHYDKDFTSYQ